LIGQAWGQKARIVPFPVSLLRIGLAPLSLSDALIGSLEMDTSKSDAGWQPKFTLAEGLRRAAQAAEAGIGQS
jgi:hypothetical protein